MSFYQTGGSGWINFSDSEEDARATWSTWQTSGGITSGFDCYAVAINAFSNVPNVFLDADSTFYIADGWYFWYKESTFEWFLVSVSEGIITSVSLL